LTECPHRFRRLVQYEPGAGTHESLAEVLNDERKLVSDSRSSEDAALLSAMNGQRGAARAFARTVRDVIDGRGQRHTFFHHMADLSTLPPIAVLWGNRDTVIPFSHAGALAWSVHGVRVTRFGACGHYPHHDRPAAFLKALRRFLDTAAVRPAHLRAGVGRGAEVKATSKERIWTRLARRWHLAPWVRPRVSDVRKRKFALRWLGTLRTRRRAVPWQKGTADAPSCCSSKKLGAVPG